MQFSFQIQSLLQNLPPETVIRNFLVQYFKEKMKIEIDRNTIQVNKNSVSLVISPVIRAKFIQLQENCKQELNEYLQEKEISVIIKTIR